MAKLTKRAVAASLHKYRGNIAAAAKALCVTRRALHWRIGSDDELKQILIDAREAMVDDGEQALAKAVKAGEGWAVCFLLKTQGRDRGYIEKHQTEHSGPGGGAIPHDVQVTHEERFIERVTVYQESFERLGPSGEQPKSLAHQVSPGGGNGQSVDTPQANGQANGFHAKPGT